nr:putative ribonuclease H-like domain-containing protein [Tanacetum cinerariifolium]
MSANDKFGLRYGDYRYGTILSYENEVLQSVFMNKECNLEDTPVNDRYAKGMHAVLPSMTGNYMPSGPDVEIDYSKYTYGTNQTSVDESDAKSSEYTSCESDYNIEPSTFMPELVVNKSKVDAFTKSKEKGTGQQAHKPVWNNVKRVNHQNKFVPSVLLTKTRKIPVNAARQNFTRQAALTSTASKVNTARPFVNEARPTRLLLREMEILLLRPQQVVIGETIDILGTQSSTNTDDPHKSLKDKEIVDSGCSRHMTGNKAHLADYQEFKGGSVAFGGSNRRITGKGKIKAGRKESNTRPLVRPRQFSWVYFLKSKDETTPILKDFIRQPENQFNHKVKTIKSDNGTEFKNHDLIEFCGLKGIKWEYSNTRTPQQNGVAERKNRTLIKAARTMLADSFLPTTFWAKAVNTACYVLNRVLVTKPQNKTPYELLTVRQPIISYLRPFGCHVTILNTINQLGKFDGKSDSGFLVGYSLNSKAFRVYNLETKRVEENLHVNFLENKPNVAGKGHAWMFDLDYLTNSMNYEPVSIENQANKSVGPKEANNSVGTHTNDDQGANSEEINLHDEYFVLPIWSAYSTTVKSSGDKFEKNEKPDANTNITNLLNVVSVPVSAVGPSKALNDDEPSYPDDPSMPYLEDIYPSPS